MQTTPDAFERQVRHIHELLERTHDSVTWNDHIPDPDNPEQLRQIDVTIRHNGQLTAVECRLSPNRQNVKWIEELMGRRQSLGASAIVGVASAGFTPCAQKKAARYGVRLYDLRRPSDADVANWAQKVSLVLYYYQYSDVCVALGFHSDRISELDVASLQRELRSHHLVQSAFNAAAQKLDELKLLAREDRRVVRFAARLQFNETVTICGQSVVEVLIEGTAHLVTKPLSTSGVFKYGNPEQTIADREVAVEKFSLTETNVVHHDDRIGIDVDLSEQLPPLSQVRFIRSSSSVELDHESCAISNPAAMRVAGPFAVKVYAVDGPSGG